MRVKAFDVVRVRARVAEENAIGTPQGELVENDTTWKSDKVVLRLSVSGCDNVEQLIASAHALCDSQAKWDQAVRECAVTSLLDLKNKNWLADDEEEVTAEEFFDRITPREIVVFHIGRFEFSCMTTTCSAVTPLR
jgi:hypothetical protein